MDGLWATKSEGVGLIVHTISFEDFQPMFSWSTNVTDGQTDGRMDDMAGYVDTTAKNKAQCAKGNSSEK